MTNEAKERAERKVVEAKREAISKARMQPKLPEEEEALARRYGAMDLGERAYNILLDLMMIEPHVDPESADYDHSNDNQFVEL